MNFLTCNSETRLRSRCNKCLICVTAFSFLSSQLGGAAGVVGIAAAELFWPCFWPLDRGKYFSLRNSITRGRFSKNWRNISEGKFQSKSFLIKVHFYQMTQIKCINKATKNPITVNFLFFWKKKCKGISILEACLDFQYHRARSLRNLNFPAKS